MTAEDIVLPAPELNVDIFDITYRFGGYSIHKSASYEDVFFIKDSHHLDFPSSQRRGPSESNSKAYFDTPEEAALAIVVKHKGAMILERKG